LLFNNGEKWLHNNREMTVLPPRIKGTGTAASRDARRREARASTEMFD